MRAGQLTQVLADYTEHERHRLPKVRACLDYWQETFAAMRTHQGDAHG